MDLEQAMHKPEPKPKESFIKSTLKRFTPIGRSEKMTDEKKKEFSDDSFASDMSMSNDEDNE